MEPINHDNLGSGAVPAHKLLNTLLQVEFPHLVTAVQKEALRPLARRRLGMAATHPGARAPQYDAAVRGLGRQPYTGLF